MERSMMEERRRQRERAIMEEGRNLWQAKKRDQLETELREQEEVGKIFEIWYFRQNQSKLGIGKYRNTAWFGIERLVPRYSICGICGIQRFAILMILVDFCIAKTKINEKFRGILQFIIEFY